MSRFLDAVAPVPRITAAELLRNRPLAILAPHPDDETLGCGALLFDASAREIACHVICVTDGGGSHPNSQRWPAPRLAQARAAELRRAVSILAPAAQVTCLGHPDGAAPDDASTAQQIADRIPQNALVLASWAGDSHRDHQQVARLARRIQAFRADVALAFYPIWGRFADRVASARLIDASPAAQAAKIRALACHRTQMTGLIDDDPTGFVMSLNHQQHFLSHPEIVVAE